MIPEVGTPRALVSSFSAILGCAWPAKAGTPACAGV
jgi:hypothetical protein